MLEVARRLSQPLPTRRVAVSRREHSSTLDTGSTSLIRRIFAVARTLLGVAYPSEKSAQANFGECSKGEVRRIPIPRTSVNKGKKKGRGCY